MQFREQIVVPLQEPSTAQLFVVNLLVQVDLVMQLDACLALAIQPVVHRFVSLNPTIILALGVMKSFIFLILPILLIHPVLLVPIACAKHALLINVQIV